ncbi:leucine dehydrogenase [Candidatus Uabimicrobium amorphum]|uniref:Leucine dehydrogenase n=1 Tax=Uabimicrobium amorphum TaxID=2596890 RepID=A0A5S9INU4_UABAM|nr:NAD(P)-binding domain-containing protein [Candidatus Uabimicrobium amorphum]BBM84951.1 leucine dehydrogenase [Candidatus Uabimicrobium amorphum]
MHKKNLSFFTMLENEEYTTLTIFNNIEQQNVEYTLNKEWSKTVVWKGQDSKGLLKKVKKASDKQFTELIEKYSLQEYLRDVVDLMKNNRHKKLIFIYDPKNNIRCILACHNTNKEYVVGGLRRALEVQSEWQIISDALCLARGMSFRCAVAGLPCSGISLAVHGPAPKGDVVDEFFGFVSYIIERFEIFVAVEGGFSGKDVSLLKSYTSNCVSEESNSKNTISLAATYSVYTAIKVALQCRYPENSQIQGKTIAVQGLGSIGSSLALQLLDEGAELIVADIDERKVENFMSRCSRPQSVVVEEFHSIPMQMGHVFAPCAFSGVIDRDTMSHFDYHIIAGGANNIMSEPVYEDEIALANLLMKKEIIYIPDWISNFGGAMHGVSLFMDKKIAA